MTRFDWPVFAFYTACGIGLAFAAHLAAVIVWRLLRALWRLADRLVTWAWPDRP